MSGFLNKIVFAVCISTFLLPQQMPAKHFFYQGQFSEAELVQLLQGKQDKIDSLEKDRKWMRLEAAAVSGAVFFVVGYCFAKWRSAS